jgi:hypothetical protein
VLISDLLGPIAPLERHLAALCATGHEVLIFHILDPAELNFTFSQASLFEDAESGSLLYIDPALARNEYLRNLEAHGEAVQITCRKLGIGYHRFATDRPMELALFDFLRARAHRGRQIRRSRGAARPITA